MTSTNKPKEQITNMPWILDAIANRLTLVADGLKEKEKAGDSSAADPQGVKEALLIAFADFAEEPDVLVEQLLKLLAAKNAK